LEKNTFVIIPNNHTFFVPEEQIVNALLDVFRLDHVEVKVSNGSLNITISEKISRFIWSTDNQLFVVDDTGAVLHEYVPEELEILNEGPRQEEQETKTKKLVTVRDLEDHPVSVGDYVLGSSIVLNILSFLSEASHTPLKVRDLEIDSREARFLRIITEEGYAVFMDPTTSMTDQLNRVLTVTKGETVDPSLYEYIDVRFGERVYIKDRL
ncbi:MAG: hypothetical protein O2877_02890, partial [bacterium]|nr:hypothetical protein [bacterium]